ncbi:hypothetical protein BHE90_007381 [Fusarium euwallaceae]|uniref:RING-type E3 ubiquitin transferase n=1 Tax=Fusarium euwallaceae TaxID=1147111 RepID=A0A430LQZ0_9HYPO|nr:hypothetical protein BHE90_007381 [Fusarium euwallaceae]
MASPSGASGHLATETARDYDALVSSDSETSDSSFDSDNIGSDQSEGCPWRTSRFYDQECSRFFDCPSHTVERSLSDTGSVHQESIHDPDDSETSHPADDRDQQNEHASRFSDEELAQIGISRDAAQPESTAEAYTDMEANSTERDAGASAGAGPDSTAPDDQGATLTTTQRPTPVEEPGSSSRDGVSAQPATLDIPPDDSENQPSPTSRPSGSARNSEYRRTWAGPSRERMDAPLPSVRSLEDALPPLPRSSRPSISSDPPRPRWQPDNEVTYCPICRTQFSFFVRKHHCRKCGRVVCNSCSPHRIIIPYQYIVRPPGSDTTMHQSLLIDGLGAGYFDVNDMSGGERVRLCNPCVPDPNTAPPQSPSPQATLSPRSAHQRSRSSIGSAYGTLPPSNRHGAVFAPGASGDPYRYLSPRMRSVTLVPPSSGSSSPGPSYRQRSGTHQTPVERLLSSVQSSSPSSYPNRYSSLGESSSRQRALPPTPQIAEEDECPICHRELPSQSLPNFEALRESHITSCIQNHSTYGTPRGEGGAPPAPRRTGMYTYLATEKDCIDDAECTICLEEFTVGVPMARLECLCRFHRACISSWFVKHPGRCPVHQHDGFGY